MNITNNLTKFSIIRLLDILFSHWTALTNQLDPILPVFNSKKYKNTTRFHFLFPIVLTLFNHVYGIIGLHYEATGNILVDFENSQHIFTHQIVPKMIWSQTDFIVFYSNFYAIMGVFLTLLFTKPIQTPFRFFVFSSPDKLFSGRQENKLLMNNKLFSERETTKMLTARRKMQIILAVVSGSFYFFLIIFFYVNVWLNNVYVRSVTSLFYWTSIFPFFIAYAVYCKLIINIKFILKYN